MVTSVNSFGVTVTHLEAVSSLTHFLNQDVFLTTTIYLYISKGSGRQSFSMTWISSFVLFLHLQFPPVHGKMYVNKSISFFWKNILEFKMCNHTHGISIHISVCCLAVTQFHGLSESHSESCQTTFLGWQLLLNEQSPQHSYQLSVE